MMKNSVHKLDALLRPKSIAIVGASAREGSFGKNLHNSIKSLGYEGQVYLINPKHSQLDGQPAYATLNDLPQPVDCVALAIADHLLPQALQVAVEAQAKSAVLFGRSYGLGVDGRALTQTLSDIGKSAGIQVCGANCMGYVNIEDKIQVTGFPFSSLKKSGNVALISHSGSTWSGIMGNLRGLRFNYGISAGQELVTGLADYMDFLIHQESTRVICLVLETVRQPEEFIEALNLARQKGIVVIALKLGRSVKGQEFAKSHSGAMSGSADVYDAIFAHHGVIVVRSLDEMMDTAELFSTLRVPHNGFIGLGCDSGGERQLIADFSEELQLPFATLGEKTVEQLEAILDPGIEATNPLDYWGDGNDCIAQCLLSLAEDPDVGTLVMATNIPDAQDFTEVCSKALDQVIEGTAKPVVLMGNVSMTMSPSESQYFRNKGIPVLMGTETALRALKHYSNYHAQRNAAVGLDGVLELDMTPTFTPQSIDLLTQWKAKLEDAGRNGQTIQDFKFLSDFGLPASPSAVVQTPEQAHAFAAQVGYPMVAKIESPNIAHKSELGGVMLGINSDAELTAALIRLQNINPGDVLLQKQLSGTEIIMGMKVDQQFGPVFTMGFGGIYVEILKDYITLLPNESAASIAKKITALKTYPLLAGARGRPVTDMGKLVEIVQGFISMGMSFKDQIQEMEINPLLVNGNEIYAVDFLLVPKNKVSI
jgi:acyl-CoA synthetase (NDP forming)